MISFSITEFPEKKIVGVVKDGYLIATIYPTDRGIKITSKDFLFANLQSMIEMGEDRTLRTPAIIINLIKEGGKKNERSV